MSTVLVVAAILIGLPGLAAAAHLGLMAMASLFYRQQARASGEEVRFLVVVPAHNEERVILRTLQSIAEHARARDLVLVVADRCTDATADIARSFGALVLERAATDAPGRAAARQAGMEHARPLEWDAVVMLDADSVVERGFFDALEGALASGARAAQARSESSRAHTLATEASVASYTLQGITIPRGRDRLGLSVRLFGAGMAIRRELALEHRFSAPASEDLFLTLDLLLQGIRCRYVEGARLVSDGASTWEAFGTQKLRHEAGRMSAARTYVPRLLGRAIRHRDMASLEAAWFLSTPPFALGALSLVLGAALASIAGYWVVAAAFGAGLLVLAFALATGLIQGRAGLRTWFALLVAPWYVVWKAGVQLRALASVLRRDKHYPPTARA